MPGGNQQGPRDGQGQEPRQQAGPGLTLAA